MIRYTAVTESESPRGNSFTDEDLSEAGTDEFYPLIKYIQSCV